MGFTAGRLRARLELEVFFSEFSLVCMFEFIPPQCCTPKVKG